MKCSGPAGEDRRPPPTLQILSFGFSTFKDMTSQKFPFQNRTSHCDSIFTPGIEQTSRKITFYA